MFPSYDIISGTRYGEIVVLAFGRISYFTQIIIDVITTYDIISATRYGEIVVLASGRISWFTQIIIKISCYYKHTILYQGHVRA